MASALIKCGQVSMHTSVWTVGNYGMHNYMQQIDMLFVSLYTETTSLYYNAVLNTATTRISRHSFTDAFLEQNLWQPNLGQDISVMFLSNEYVKKRIT